MAYFERFVSRRYLLAHENKRLVTFISFISVAGVSVGVAALIIVLGIIDGIDQDYFSRFMGISPHVKIRAEAGLDPAQAEQLHSDLMAMPEILVAERVIERQVLLERGAGADSPKVPCLLIGLEGLGDGHLYGIRYANTGAGIALDERQMLLGWLVARKLHVMPGEPVVATTGKLQRTPSGWMSRRRNLRVFDQFGTGVQPFDEATAFVSLATGQIVFGLGDTVDSVQAKIKNPFAVRKLKERLEAIYPADAGFRITTWEEENAELFGALKLERIGLFVALLLVVIVAGFNIIGTLILMVREKTPAIGVLKSFGASDRMIRAVFLRSGITIGLIGTTSGLALGLLGCAALIFLPRFFPTGALSILQHLPVTVRPVTIAMIVASAMAISLIAAVFPASQAARLDTVEALRREG